MPIPGSLGGAVHTKANRRRDVEVRSKATRLDGEKTEEFDEEIFAAQALGTSVRLNHTNLVKFAAKITRVSDGHEYVRGTDYTVGWVVGRWTNLAITPGTSVKVSYFHEELAVDGHVIFGPAGEVEQRRNLQVQGGVTVTDDAANERTIIDVSATPSASSLLTSIKTVDGSGSGLDADLLDGLNSTAFATATHDHDSRYYTETEVDALLTASALLTKIKTVDGSGSGLDADLLDGQDSSAFATVADVAAAALLTKIKTVDGSGSGLDADLLDGQNSTAFATASSVAALTPGHVIRDEGTARTQRQFLNFEGAGVSVADDSAGAETVVTIPGGGSGGSGSARYASLVKMGAA